MGRRCWKRRRRRGFASVARPTRSSAPATRPAVARSTKGGSAATVMNHGMEHWHPNPDFFYRRGAGPVLDLGVYYVTQPGEPARAVGAGDGVRRRRRRGRSAAGRCPGQVIKVEVPTTVNGALLFIGGANVSLSASWDVWKHDWWPCEPVRHRGHPAAARSQFFRGDAADQRARWRVGGTGYLGASFREPNRILRSGAFVGLMSSACWTWRWRSGRDGRIAPMAHSRCVLEVMEALERSSLEGRHVAITSRCDRRRRFRWGWGRGFVTEP